MNTTFTHTTKLGFSVLLAGCCLCYTSASASGMAAKGPSSTISQPLSYKIQTPSSASNKTTPKATAANQAPVFTFTASTTSDVGEQVTLMIEASDPDLEDQVTLTIDSAQAYGSNTAENFAEATFSPSLPHTAAGTARAEMSWIPQKKHRGYIEFFFTARDQHGNQIQESYLYFVDMPLTIKPVPPVQLAADQTFESILTIEEADWHELYELSFMDEAPVWLQAEALLADGSYYIRLWGSPQAHDLGSYQLMLYAETIFGKWDTSILQIEVADGTNQTCFRDEDGDGYGSLSDGARLTSISAPKGFATNTDDCDDANSTIHPGATEVADDGVDNNCDGRVDEAADCPAVLPLSLTASCSDNPALDRQWLIHNPNSCAIMVNWGVHRSSQQGSLLVPPGDTYFTTAHVSKGADLAFISWTDGQGKTSQKSANAATMKCNKQKSKAGNRSADTALASETLQAYPMPFGEKLSLSHSNITAASTARLHLIATDGRQYDLSTQMRIAGEGNIELELQQASIPAGMYILRLWVDDAQPVFIRVVKSSE